MTDSFDPYAVLQVAPDADDAVLAAAYRALARRYHPDIAGDSATGHMARLNNAWELVRDPERRRRFDDERRRGRPTAAHGQAAATPDPYRWSGFRDGTGAAGPPPGRPSGSVLDFGRHIGWSIGEIARVDPGYLEWLETKPQGRRYTEEIEATLRRTGWRQGPAPEDRKRRPLFRR